MGHRDTLTDELQPGHAQFHLRWLTGIGALLVRFGASSVVIFVHSSCSRRLATFSHNLSVSLATSLNADMSRISLSDCRPGLPIEPQGTLKSGHPLRFNWSWLLFRDLGSGIARIWERGRERERERTTTRTTIRDSCSDFYWQFRGFEESNIATEQPEGWSDKMEMSWLAIKFHLIQIQF